jgi:hypothetical protein
MILSIELEQIISEISEELNIPKVKIRYVILSMFKFLSNTVRSASTGEAETYKCVIIKNLGKFRKNRKVLRKFK